MRTQQGVGCVKNFLNLCVNSLWDLMRIRDGTSELSSVGMSDLLMHSKPLMGIRQYSTRPEDWYQRGVLSGLPLFTPFQRPEEVGLPLVCSSWLLFTSRQMWVHSSLEDNGPSHICTLTPQRPTQLFLLSANSLTMPLLWISLDWGNKATV